uniref:Pentatricopeptide repeat-containing protein n=1 Tax=Kalanchoe fedtschenkoi TaxID=63787 RepID=A0A7N0VIH7_KALFE
MFLVKPLSARCCSTSTSTRNLSCLTSSRTLKSLHSNLNGDDEEQEVQRVYSIIMTASSPANMAQSLTNAGVFLSNDLIDKVLKRVRFSHGNPLLALQFFYFTHQRQGFYHTPFSLDTMLYTLGRSRKFSLMWDLLADVKKKDSTLITPKTLQVVLARIANVCSVRETVDSFSKFKQFLPEFGTPCFNGLLRTLCQEKSMSDARNVYHSLKHKFKPDLQTFNVLLSGWKSSEEAEEFFEEMRNMGVQPDIVSYNSLIDVYCKDKRLDKAYSVYSKMLEEDVSPDVITYTSIIGGLGLVGQPDKAVRILKEMHEYGCYPDVAAYNATIRNFCIAKRFGEAYRLLDEMVNKDVMPNATTYNLFFRCFYWSNDLGSSWSLYQRMMRTGCLPNTQTCMFLIRLMKRQEKVEMALALWDDMIEKDFGAYVLVSDVLFDLLCDMGKLEELERCFLQMIAKGQKPSNVSFKRLKVLMELANRHQALQNISEKMLIFVPSSAEKVDSTTMFLN